MVASPAHATGLLLNGTWYPSIDEAFAANDYYLTGELIFFESAKSSLTSKRRLGPVHMKWQGRPRGPFKDCFPTDGLIRVDLG
jgi:hypothetical protein